MAHAWPEPMKPSEFIWVAVKEQKLSYHIMDTQYIMGSSLVQQLHLNSSAATQFVPDVGKASYCSVGCRFSCALSGNLWGLRSLRRAQKPSVRGFPATSPRSSFPGFIGFRVQAGSSGPGRSPVSWTSLPKTACNLQSPCHNSQRYRSSLKPSF